eukprot:GHVP01059448.1.p1 GENE.GHVP01059448.1~~GHVP01059448.1.p1  ORF type:complete len:109 (+),score=21.37 GHVP01059448.1:546-872(+)
MKLKLKRIANLASQLQSLLTLFGQEGVYFQNEKKFANAQAELAENRPTHLLVACEEIFNDLSSLLRLGEYKRNFEPSVPLEGNSSTVKPTVPPKLIKCFMRRSVTTGD